jgi:hypothetical protein
VITYRCGYDYLYQRRKIVVRDPERMTTAQNKTQDTMQLQGTLRGIEAMSMIRQGQVKGISQAIILEVNNQT